MELETLYNTNIGDEEIMYVDLPYKDEVLHIAANTPQLLKVPKHLRSRVITILKNQLQNRALKMLEAVAGDVEEVSKMQMKITHFRSKVLNDVYAILRSEEEASMQHRRGIERNGYEYYFVENSNPFDDDFDYSDFEEKDTDEQPDDVYVCSNEVEDHFEEKRRRMNDEFFASLNTRNKESVNPQEEREDGKVMLYTNLQELMDHQDLSVRNYSNAMERFHFVNEKDRDDFHSLLDGLEEQMIPAKPVTDEDLLKEFEAYCGDQEEGDDLVLEVRKDGMIFVARDWMEGMSEGVEKEGMREEVRNKGKSEEVGKERKSEGVEKEGMSEGVRNEGKSEGVEKEGRREGVGKEGKSEEVGKEGMREGVEKEGKSEGVEKEGKSEGVEKNERGIEDNLIIEKAITKKEKVESEMKIVEENGMRNMTDNEEKHTPTNKDYLNETTVQVQEIPSKLQTEAEKLFDLPLQEVRQHKQTLLQQYQHVSSQNAFVSEDIIIDILEILQIFGIPYVFSPCEAEAQCSYLEMMGLVDGVISNDSDVLAFGGKCVFKNFFVDNQYVEEYRMEDLEREKGLTRERIIEFAILRGCDYCEVELTSYLTVGDCRCRTCGSNRVDIVFSIVRDVATSPCCVGEELLNNN